MPDVRRRIAMAKSRFGKLRHLWSDNDLHLNLKLATIVQIERMQHFNLRL